MAKFAIALCILATVCGTQAGFSGFMSTLIGQGPEKQLKSLTAKAEGSLSDLQASWSRYLKISSDLLILIEDTANDAIERCVTEMNELFARGNLSEADIALCTNTTELEIMLAKITDPKADCVEAKSSEVEAIYHELTNQLQDLITTSNDALASIKSECGFWKFYSCQSRIAQPVLNKNKTTVNDLIAESEKIRKEIAELPKKLPDCFDTHALQRIVVKLSAVYADAEKCMNNAKANSNAKIVS
ncbi:uncharacterized protein LOC125499966 [Athalia rosae]|uniref:uncharacterized protein LOC125499966 n=1 Tax=Athalia rosae TaxID=37344 RepID=UPI0020348148|nr:uncharacterized protein LOC125499966 [Athalia rosae]